MKSAASRGAVEAAAPAGADVADTSAAFCDPAADQGVVRAVRMHPGILAHVGFRPGPAASRPRVLVVEDEYFLADDIARALVRLGAEAVGPVPTSAAA